MAIDFKPTRGNYTDLTPFRFWCQKVLPLVYDESLSYYELLCKVVDYLNKTMEDVGTLNDDITALYDAFDQLQDYVDNYFTNLDVQEEINNKLDAMAADGTLTELMAPLIRTTTTAWLQQYVNPETGYVIDSSFTVENAAADAKAVGDLVFPLERIVNETLVTKYSNWIQGGISSTTGQPASNSYNCYSDPIEIEKFIKADHVIGWRMRYFAYDETMTFLGYRTASQNAASGFTYNSIKTNHPTVKYVRFDCGYYLEGTQQQTTPDMVGENVSIQYAASEHTAATENITLSDIQDFADPTDRLFKQSFTVSLPYTGNPENQILTVIAKTITQTGTTKPYIYFGLGSGLNRSGNYTLADDQNYEMKKFRIIRYPGDASAASINITIPTGCEVDIKYFTSEFSDEKTNESRIIYRGHRKMSMTPEDSLAGLLMGAKAGAKYFIEIPKRLSDGVWICYHDDTLVYDETYIRADGGGLISSEYDGVSWSEINYETANSWDWGLSKGEQWAGTKPLTLDQFFKVCAKTGVHPCLSIHPMPTAAELEEIKELAKKYNVLETLNIKSSTTYASRVIGVFGNDIESYTVDVSSGAQNAAAVQAAITALSSGSLTTKKIIELFASTAYNAYFGSNPFDAFKLITDAGMTASLAQQTGNYHPVISSASVIMWEQDIEYWISKGVTEFTYEYDWNYGLNG